MAISFFREFFIFKKKRPVQNNDNIPTKQEQKFDRISIECQQISQPVNKSHRKEDMAAEAELAKFMDENLYDRLLTEGQFKSIDRVYDKETQLTGIDVIAKTETASANIDEKAQLYYINKDIPTFAFELQSTNRGIRTEGWFLNDSLKTDLYLLIWPHAKTDKVKQLKKEDITHIDALLVSKKRLRGYLDKRGLSKEELQRNADELYRSEKYEKTPSGCDGIYYYFSPHEKYAEAPINLVIRKSHLIDIAQAHYKITPSGFKRISK